MKDSVYKNRESERLNAKLFSSASSAKEKLIFAAKQLLMAIISAIISGSTVFTYCNPFGVMLASAAPIEYLPVCTVGATIGYLIAGYEVIPIKYISALILVIIIKRILIFAKIENESLISGLSGLIASAVTGIGTSLLMDEVNITLIPYIFESLIIGTGALFWSRGIDDFKSIKSFTRLKASEIACLLFSVYLILLGFNHISIFYLNISRIISLIIMMICSYYGKISGGAISGICAGLSMGLGSENPYVFALFCVLGIVSGITASLGKFACISGAIITGGVFFALINPSNISALILVEIAIASMAFLAIPSRILDSFSLVDGERLSASQNGMKYQAAVRLREASGAIDEIADNVKTINAKLKSFAPSGRMAIYKNTMIKTCEGCGLKFYCWEQQADYTASIFKKILKELENDEELKKNLLPNDFGSRCIRSDELIKNFTEQYKYYTNQQLADKKLEEMHSTIALQYDALSSILYDLSVDIENKETPDSRLTSILFEILNYYEISYNSACVTTDNHNHMKIEIKSDEPLRKFNEKHITKDIEEVCKRRFSPAIQKENGQIVYFEEPAYETDFAFCQINADDGAYCGDSFESFKDNFGRSITVLSDGMGKGAYAHIDSVMASSIIKKLLNTGISPSGAIKVVNSALMAKNNTESFATLDMAIINLYTGKARFLKAGATSSFIIKGGKFMKIELSSLPVGIVKEADFASTSANLKDGDIIITVSDGVTQGRIKWIKEISLNYSDDISALAKAIASGAANQQYSAHQDDITVLITKLKSI